MSLELSRLKELVKYIPETGEFIRLSIGTSGNQRYLGKPSGSFTRKGYRHLSLDGKSYRACRVAWFYMMGEWPQGQVDHRNSKKWDDRWVNLRLATPEQNQRNTGAKATNTSGYKGVSYLKRRKPWRAHIRNEGKQVYLGSFYHIEEAIEAYREAATRYHGDFARFEKEYDL